jgi:hypothetical protein
MPKILISISFIRGRTLIPSVSKNYSNYLSYSNNYSSNINRIRVVVFRFFFK